MIPSDDEDGIGHRCSSHASSSNSQRAEKLANLEALPSTVAAAAATWRAFNRPRMALAVLAVSLQHIAAHSDHLQYHQHRRRESLVAKADDHRQRADEVEQQQQPEGEQRLETVAPQPLPPLPAELPADVQAFSLDEGIEPDR